MEYFTCMMDTAVHSKRIVPLFWLVSTIVSHLIYANDLLVLLQPSMRRMRALSDIMEEFGRLSGLQLNRKKSIVYFSSRCTQQEERAFALGVDRGELPVKYLGVPLTVNYAREQDCHSLVDFAQRRVEGWQATGLSFGGRIELVRSVIASITMFWLQSIQIPTATIRKVEAICADFIWRGGMQAISWDQSMSASEGRRSGVEASPCGQEGSLCEGGLEIHQGGSLLAEWMANRYLRRTNFWACRIDNNFLITFKAILGCRPVLQTAICRNMKDGTTTDLWLDLWLGSRSLLELLGGQLDREADRGLTCSRIIRDGVWRPEGYPYTAPLAEEIRLITIDASQHEDSWSWAGPGTGGGSGLFCFRSCYDLVRTQHDRTEEVDFIWGKGVARKMQLCAYHLLRDKLMMRDRLLRFGIQIPDAKCVLCNEEDESMGHLFFVCPVT
ncbi:uncharacterized protein M6B38_177225 [Iris pallida]|uniref:Reverse transcriptase zinc-binding domain-containing protein n=1 Tax=Iris pallida TaxID=29817 RepID=A0AAX6EPQ0_IRIPA|nr:uncharacterized protein M6B38_177225 [Iris pallida]